MADGGGDVSATIFAESIALFAEYIEWRAAHPSDDLMTDLLNAELEEGDGTRRPLERTEVLAYTAMIDGPATKPRPGSSVSWVNCSVSIRISGMNWSTTVV